MKTLIEIIEEQNLFKGNHKLGTDKEFVHQYISHFYQEVFQPLQEKPIRLFEIGTCSGASLKMWKHFFVNGKIEGVDNVNVMMDEYKENDVEYYHADAYYPNFVNWLPMYDIIIDDGPHTLQSQLEFLRLYPAKLNDGGILVIEDIDTDEAIEQLSAKALEVFGKPANVIDRRKEINLNNEVLLWIQK